MFKEDIETLFKLIALCREFDDLLATRSASEADLKKLAESKSVVVDAISKLTNRTK